MSVRIGVIGVGGVGGYFGGKLCRSLSAEEGEVYFVARGRHLEEIRRNGLCVSTSDEGQWHCRPAIATDRIDDLPPLDICLVCVKSYDLHAVLKGLVDRLKESTLVVPLLNGIDIYERMRNEVSVATIFPACVYVGTHIETYGKVTQNGGACKILFGKDPQYPGFVPRDLFGLFDKSSIKYAWVEDVYREIWTKYIFIAAFGLVSAAYDATLGKIMESQELSGYVRSIMGEIAALSEKKGIGLAGTIVGDTFGRGRDFPYETKTSFQRDFERMDKPDERDLFGGTIIRLGEAAGVDTPATRQLHELLNRRKPL